MPYALTNAHHKASVGTGWFPRGYLFAHWPFPVSLAWLLHNTRMTNAA
jgi:hypothetical protein